MYDIQRKIIQIVLGIYESSSNIKEYKKNLRRIMREILPFF